MGTCWLWYGVADGGVPSLDQALRVTVAVEGVPSLGLQQLVRQSIPSLNVAHHLFIAPTT